MTKYYLHDGVRQSGPFSVDELKEKKISSEARVWTEGMSGWKMAGEVEDLEPLFAGMPPPFEAQDAKHAPLFGPESMEAAKKYMDDARKYMDDGRKKLSRWYGTIGGIAAVLLLLLIIWNGRQTALILSSIKDEKASKREMRDSWPTSLKVDVEQSGGKLNVTFINNSNFLMNEMKASISYMGSNGAINRASVVAGYNVPPHGTASAQLADGSYSNEKVTIQLKGATSAQAEFRLGENYNSREPGDPYHMH
ncbi:MAG: DUF4339 domain-containing protein [Chitinophagaceae bacterium]|nr:MAG: DUF4339 domain-containing protein [Chitinophagaceae bacterium]